MTNDELNNLKAEDIDLTNIPELPLIEPGRKFLIVGSAGSGKDTTAMILSKLHVGVRYGGSTSLCMLDLVQNIYESLTGHECDPTWFYEKRSKLRKFWFECIKAHRLIDPLFVIKRSLQDSDIICGCRDIEEIKSAVDTIENLTIIYVLYRGTILHDPTWLYTPISFQGEVGLCHQLYGTPASIISGLSKINDLQPVRFGEGLPLNTYTKNGVYFGGVLERTVTLQLGAW